MNHNFDKTFYGKAGKENDEQLNCSVPFHPPITSKLTGEKVDICNNSETGMKAVDHYWLVFNRKESSPLDKPCAGMNIYLGLPFINHDESKNDAYIRLYIKPDVKVKNVVLYYDFTTFVAEVGGYVGIFLGMSLVDFTILCNSAFFKMVTKNLK